MQQWIDIILNQVHTPLEMFKYESTNVRNNTNCYSHAIGATYPELEIYRIGAISNLKSIDQKYTSKEEILNLLFEDLKTLKLKYEEIDLDNDVDLEENQYIIKLYIQFSSDGKIFDYHFIRFEDGKWTEKRKLQRVSELYHENMYDKRYLWEHVVTLKITR